MLIYNKPFLSLHDQLALLKQRGLLVEDDALAIDCLHRNGYYRLSAYWYPFREIVATIPPTRGDKFRAGSHFEDARALYVFDKKLKLLLLDAIERIEIAVRVDIALQLGARDPFAHTNPALLHPHFLRPNARGDVPYDLWKDKFDGMVRRSKDEFVLHHHRKYGANSPLPIWIAIELWDFGLMSHFYSGMRINDRQSVAARFGVPDWQLMQSWLRCLNYVRNVIAHHGRLWNLNLTDRPRLPMRGAMPDFDPLLSLPNVIDRIYSACCILGHFSRVVNSGSSWPTQFAQLISSFPPMPHAGVQDMGFPSKWQTHSFWT